MAEIAATIIFVLVLAFPFFACVAFICCGLAVIKITKEFLEEKEDARQTD